MKEVLQKLQELGEGQAKLLAIQEFQNQQLQKQEVMLLKHAEILTRNTVTVEEHHKRSTMLENQMRDMKTEVDDIQAHVLSIQGAGKLVTWLGLIVGVLTGIAGAIYGIIEFFKG